MTEEFPKSGSGKILKRVTGEVLAGNPGECDASATGRGFLKHEADPEHYDELRSQDEDKWRWLEILMSENKNLFRNK